MTGRIDVILDGGSVGIGLESTIVDLTVDPPQILRPGYITGEMLSEILERVEDDPTLFSVQNGQAPRAPGMKYRHYAPKGDLVIARGSEEKIAAYVNEKAAQYQQLGEKTGVICVTQTAGNYRCDAVKIIGDRGDEETIARSLYRILREFDDENVTKIFSEEFGETGGEDRGLGRAIMNRLLKAAGHQVLDL